MRSFVGKRVLILLITGEKYRGLVESISLNSEIALIENGINIIVFPYHSIASIREIKGLTDEQKQERARLEGNL